MDVGASVTFVESGVDYMSFDRICQNCSSFFQDSEDMDLGVCLNDEVFQPFLDEIINNEDFSSCYELYKQKRYDGRKKACEQYEEPEFMEIPEGEDISTYIHYEALKHQNVEEIVNYLYSSDMALVKNAISAISTYVYIGNRSAYEGLLNYYLGLGPAESLDDVHIRMKIIDMFSRYESERATIEAYVNELARTPSNNTTRQLYSLVLKRLNWCPHEIVHGLLLELLGKQKYSYKIRKRIMDVAGI